MNKQSTTKGFAILSAAGMLAKILSLLYIPFLLKIIGKEGYGIYGAAYMVYAFIYVITNSGIPVAISKLISELTAVKNYSDAVKSFKMARLMLFGFGILMMILMMLLAYPLARAVHFEKAYLAILALSPAVFFTSVASAYRGYYQGRGNMKPTAISQVIEQVINAIFTLVFAAMFVKYSTEAGCAGGTIGTTLGALISAIYLIVYYERHKVFKVPKGYRNMHMSRYTNKQLIKKIIGYGLPITICVGMTYTGNIVDLKITKMRLMATGIFTDAEATIKYGVLMKYQQLLNVPIAIISALSAAILPAIAGAVALKDRKDVKNKISYAFRLCFLVAFPSAVGLAVLSEPIFHMIFTKEFSEGAILMVYGSGVLILMSVVQIQTTILQSLGKLYTATFYALLGIIVKIIANYILIARPSINILGAVFGTMIGFSIPLILNQIIINKSLKIKFNMAKEAFKPAVASIFMGLAVYLTNLVLGTLIGLVSVGYIANLVNTVISILIGVFTYMYALIVTGVLTQSDIDNMPSKLTKVIPNNLLNKVKS